MFAQFVIDGAAAYTKKSGGFFSIVVRFGERPDDHDTLDLVEGRSDLEGNFASRQVNVKKARREMLGQQFIPFAHE